MNRIYITVFLLGFCLVFSSCKENGGQVKKLGGNELDISQEPPLEYQIRPASPASSEPVPLLIFLHGYGSNEVDTGNFAKSFDDRCMVVSVRAPYKISENKYKWYQFERKGHEYNFSYDELKKSRARIIQLIKSLQKEYNIDKDKIMVGGFSQGAMMSLAISLKHSDLISGAMILSGDLLTEIEQEIMDKKIDKRLDIYISHGRQDRVLSFAEAVKDIKFLKAKGIDVYEQYFDSAHTISRENFISLNRWLGAKISP